MKAFVYVTSPIMDFCHTCPQADPTNTLGHLVWCRKHSRRFSTNPFCEEVAKEMRRREARQG